MWRMSSGTNHKNDMSHTTQQNVFGVPVNVRYIVRMTRNSNHLFSVVFLAHLVFILELVSPPQLFIYTLDINNSQPFT